MPGRNFGGISFRSLRPKLLVRVCLGTSGILPENSGLDDGKQRRNLIRFTVSAPDHATTRHTCSFDVPIVDQTAKIRPSRYGPAKERSALRPALPFTAVPTSLLERRFPLGPRAPYTVRGHIQFPPFGSAAGSRIFHGRRDFPYRPRRSPRGFAPTSFRAS